MTYDVRGRPIDLLEKSLRDLPRTYDIDLPSRLITPGLFLALAGHAGLAVELWRRATSPLMTPLNHVYHLGPLIAACGGAGLTNAPDRTVITQAELGRIDLEARLRMTLAGSPEMQPFIAIRPQPELSLLYSAFKLARPKEPHQPIDERPTNDELQALPLLEEWLSLPERPLTWDMGESAYLLAADIAARLSDRGRSHSFLRSWLRHGMEEARPIDLGAFLSLRSLSRLAASGLLKGDLGLSDGDCQRLGAQLIEAADRRLGAGRDAQPAFSDWNVLLQAISTKALAETDQLAIAESISDQQRLARWLGQPGATQEQIADAEARLGARLPPSYRAFLETSNGFGPIATSVFRMRSVDEIEWFRYAEPETLAIWLESPDDIGEAVDEESYRQYGNSQGPMRKRYLKTALQVSDYQEGVVLLIPDVVTSSGEWEAWYFTEDAWRFPSFRDLMEEASLVRE
jgi:hypothetical protein